jgi:hypothetical protein
VSWKPDARTNDKQTYVALLKKATGVNYGKEGRYDAGDRLLDFYSDRGLPTHIDEAHLVLPAGLQALRHIYKDDDTRFPLVLSGGPRLLENVLANEEFDRLVAHWVYFDPLTPPQVLAVMPQWHWLYEAADELQLTRINDQFGQGIFGKWALFTNLYLLEAAARGRDPVLHDDLIEVVLDKRRPVTAKKAPKTPPGHRSRGVPPARRERQSKAPRRQ